MDPLLSDGVHKAGLNVSEMKCAFLGLAGAIVAAFPVARVDGRTIRCSASPDARHVLPVYVEGSASASVPVRVAVSLNGIDFIEVMNVSLSLWASTTCSLMANVNGGPRYINGTVACKDNCTRYECTLRVPKDTVPGMYAVFIGVAGQGFPTGYQVALVGSWSNSVASVNIEVSNDGSAWSSSTVQATIYGIRNETKVSMTVEPVKAFYEAGTSLRVSSQAPEYVNGSFISSRISCRNADIDGAKTLPSVSVDSSFWSTGRSSFLHNLTVAGNCTLEIILGSEVVASSRIEVISGPPANATSRVSCPGSVVAGASQVGPCSASIRDAFGNVADAVLRDGLTLHMELLSGSGSGAGALIASSEVALTDASVRTTAFLFDTSGAITKAEVLVAKFFVVFSGDAGSERVDLPFSQANLTVQPGAFSATPKMKLRLI
eukprot:tig00000189_g14335.t1